MWHLVFKCPCALLRRGEIGTGQGNTSEDIRLDTLSSLGVTEDGKKLTVSALQTRESEETQLEYASGEFVDNRMVRVVVVRLKWCFRSW